MARVIIAPQIQADIDRIFVFLFENVPDSAAALVAVIVSTIDVLETSARVGRPTDGSKRELVISTGASGLYQYLPELDTVFVLAIRSQREVSYRS
jgi:toxin ParE1/3/4